MKFFYAICTSVFLLLFNPLHAHIHKIDHWVNGDQHLFCLSDFHNSTHKENQVCDVQRDALVQAAHERNGFVITEDIMIPDKPAFLKNPLDYDPNNSYLGYSIDSFKSWPDEFLVGLTPHCHYRNIPVYNVEFRHAKIRSLCNGDLDASFGFPHAEKIKAEIAAYDDGNILNDYYQTKLEEYNRLVAPCFPLFDALAKQDCSLKDAIAKVPYTSSIEPLLATKDSYVPSMDAEQKKYRTVLLYDAPLLDLRILHAIKQNSHYPAIFLCLGGAHIRRLEEGFEKIGFSKVASHGTSYPVRNGKYVEPDALDLTHYFKNILTPEEVVEKEDTRLPHSPTTTSPIAILFLLGTFAGLLAFVPFAARNRKIQNRR